MKIQTSRFGELEVHDEQMLTMPNGLLGFEDVTQYCLIPHGPESPFRWLQAVAMPELAFIVVNPYDFFMDYDVSLPAGDAQRIGLQHPEDAVVLTVVTVRNGEVTTNLVGPIVVHARTHVATQVVLADSPYSTRHSLLSTATAA
jgi:flagellar assembly factor FliW